MNAPAAASASTDAPRPSARNPVVGALNQMMVSVLGEQVREMFERADDVLFDSAEKAHAAEEQRLYLDTMRTLRLQRARIMEQFRRSLDDALSRIEADADLPQVDADDISQWSLQDGDALEERLAISNMEAKASAMHAHELGELRRRLSSLSLLVSGRLNEEAMSPGRIIRRFQDSMKDLTVDFPIKLVIYKLFDRVVLSRLSELFTGANQLLAINGVEPAAGGSPPREERPAAAMRAVAGVGAGPAAPAWMTQLDPATVSAFGVPLRGAAAPATPYAAAAGVPLPPEAGWVPTAWAPAGSVPAAPHEVPGTDYPDALLAAEIGKILHGYREGRRPEAPSWLPPESVALIARMFDRYYRDSRMPDALKPVLGKLQLPMVKAALGDPTFFSDPGHPARRVINDLFDLMLRFGAADGGGDKQTTLAELHAMVDAFAASMRLDPQRLQQTPPRLDAETAETFIREQDELQHQKSGMQIERVRRVVAHELRQHVGERSLAPGVMRLLLSGFGPILSVDYIRGGTDSAAWRESMQLVDRVIASLSGSGDPERQGAEEAEIVAAVSNRLARVGFSDARLSEVIAGLLAAYREKQDKPRNEPAADAPAQVQSDETRSSPPPEAPPRLTPENELRGLMSILLVPNTWFTLIDRRTETKHWVRVKTHYPAQNAVLFAHYMEPRFVRWRVSSLASGLVDGTAALVDPSPELHAAVLRLREIPFSHTQDPVDWIGTDGKPAKAESPGAKPAAEALR